MNEQLEKIHSDIIKWGFVRGLTTLNPETENMLFLEESTEYNQATFDRNITDVIDALCDMYVVYTQTIYKTHHYPLIDTEDDLVPINFVTYAGIPIVVEQFGYDFVKCMQETIKTINSRKGFINEAGKFEKFKEGDEGFEPTYVSDFDKCKYEVLDEQEFINKQEIKGK